MKPFLDTNVLIYAFSRGSRAARARELLELGGIVGVQCLNEFANVALTKLRMNWDEILAGLREIRFLCEVAAPLDLGLHDHGLAIARRYRLAVFDGLILAAAIASGCQILWSEDMQDGLVAEDALLVRNPFR